jgi:hypothetical protein
MAENSINNINYRIFVFEAFKITVFCLVVAALFKSFGVSNSALLIVFNMAVMSSAATFSVEQKRLNHIAVGSIVIIISIIMGGIIGFYYPWLAKLITILYAWLAFYLPKMKYQTNIFVTGSVMFLVFSALPFNSMDGIFYMLYGLIVFSIFVGFYWLFEYVNLSKIENNEIMNSEQIKNNHITAMIAVLSLTLAWSISYVLSLHFYFSHLYWIGLTALVVIQGSQQKTIQTSIKRILVNAFGAIVIVLLFNYVLPPDFWVNFIMLVLFLFLIFSLSFSYVGRTLFIELFVLGFTHLLGDYQNVIAVDRVILTLIGGIIVIFSTPIAYFFGDYIKPHET